MTARLAPMRWILLAAIAVVLGTGASGSEAESMRARASAGKVVTVYVATLRVPDAGGEVTFGAGQSPVLRYARYAISIPPTHRSDSIEWPKGPPDPATDFVTLDAKRLSEAEFRADVSGKSVRLFVHGFNNSFQESLYRQAQVAVDVRDKRVPVLFAWPSKGSALSYGADRAAAAASVDGLARTITLLVERRRARLLVVAHSMGGWLTIEALAKLSRERRKAAFGRFTNVVLAAPDIDIDDMVRKLEIIGRLPRPLTVLVASDDVALNLSRLISGGRRVGSDDIRDPRVQAAARRFGARIIDISRMKASDGFRHGRFTAMAALYPKFHAQLENPSSPLYAMPGVFVFDAVSSRFLHATRVAVSRNIKD